MQNISKKLKFLMEVSRADAVISRKFHGQGLGFVDLAVLYAITQAQEGKIRRIDLADQVGLTASGVTRLLIPLEKIGVIKREANEFDARISYVSLTKSGLELFQDSIKIMEEKVDDIISDSELLNIEQAITTLNKITK